MPTLKKKLNRIAGRLDDRERLHVAVFGLGSVGHYLLDYLIGLQDPQLRIYVVGRNSAKLLRDVNIARVAALIRGGIASEIEIVEADFSSVDSVATAIAQIRPDIIVNASRAYSGLAYGSISWRAIRAYGVWAPLSVRYIRTIMQAYREVDASAIVINASFPDATNAWLKSAGLPHPDFGSGNLNHLVPRIKLAAAAGLGLDQPEGLAEIDVTIATSRFHSVLISEEGVTEGVEPLLRIEHHGREVAVEPRALYRRCAIPMPADRKRNMMGASSNIEIIHALLQAVRGRQFQKLHSPGFDGLLGGYPVCVRSTEEEFTCEVFERPFTLAEMTAHNRESIHRDGIADVRDGTLSYTPELQEKVRSAFGFALPAGVTLADSDALAEAIIDEVITPHLAAGTAGSLERVG